VAYLVLGMIALRFVLDSARRSATLSLA
jgi:hypothetical protein